MVLTGHSFEGLKQQSVWTNKLLVGGSDPLQTTGAVGEWAVSGTQSTLWVSGTISGTSVVGINQISGAQFLSPGSFSTASSVVFTAGSNVGTVHQLTTRAIITGGMWVNISGAGLVVSSPASSESPIGVCLATVGSNATANILTQGFAYLRAEATLNAGSALRQGAAASADTFIGAGSPAFGARGVVVGASTSGTSNFSQVYIF